MSCARRTRLLLVPGRLTLTIIVAASVWTCTASTFTAPATFVGGPWYLVETLELGEEGRFRYELWSDDGGTVCEVAGLWTRVSAGRISTEVEDEAGSTSSCGSLPAIEIWSFRAGKLHRSGLQPYRRVLDQGLE